ncbi:MAG: hypothetical protein HY243_06540 [Proteobacteria bacterium]|nr:hypothetical protein [Pseudomonadota bacterium]
MSNPQYFSDRAIRYRKLAGDVLYVKHGDELSDIAMLFDRMADSVRDHDVEQSRLQHRKIIDAFESVSSGWVGEIGSTM